MALPTLNNQLTTTGASSNYSNNRGMDAGMILLNLNKQQVEYLDQIKNILTESLNLQNMAEEAKKDAERMKVEASREKYTPFPAKDKEEKGLFKGGFFDNVQQNGLLSTLFGERFAKGPIGKLLGGIGKFTGTALVGAALLGIGVDAVAGYLEAEDGEKIKGALIRAFSGDAEGGWDNAIRKSVEWAVVGGLVGSFGGPMGLIAGALIGGAIGGVAGYLGSDKVKEIVTKAGDYFNDGWDANSIFIVGGATLTGALLGAPLGPIGMVAGGLLGAALGVVGDYFLKEKEKDIDVKLFDIDWVSILGGVAFAGLAIATGGLSIPASLALGFAVTGISGLWNAYVNDDSGKVGQEYADGASAIWNTVWGYTKEIFTNAYDFIMNFDYSGTFNDAVSIWNSGWGYTKEIFSDAYNNIMNFDYSGTFNDAVSIWNSVWGYAKTMFLNAFETIVGVDFSTAFGQTKQMLTDLMNDVSKSFKKFIYENVISNLPDWAVPDSVEKYFSDVYNFQNEHLLGRIEEVEQNEYLLQRLGAIKADIEEIKNKINMVSELSNPEMRTGGTINQVNSGGNSVDNSRKQNFYDNRTFINSKSGFEYFESGPMM